MEIALNNFVPHPLREGGSGTFPLTFEIAPGARRLVKSASGKGKTSIVHSIYGTRRDYDGTVTLDGAEARSIPPLEWASIRREKLAVVFQDLRLFPELSGIDNLLLKNRLTDAKTEAEIWEIADRLGVDRVLKQTAGTMSFGQRQRVAVARALAQPFEALLLDEPFSHLDRENAEIVRALVEEEAARQKASIVLTTLEDDREFSYDQTTTL
jgi:ABC-type lipoprotein export system ATPase subunit